MKTTLFLLVFGAAMLVAAYAIDNLGVGLVGAGLVLFGISRVLKP